MKLIPRTVNDLTLKQYIELNKIERENIDDTEKADKIISLITGIDIDFVTSKMPLDKLEFYYKSTADLRASLPTKKLNKVIRIDGKRYKVAENEKKLNANQFVLAETYRVNHFSNYHLLAAIIYMDCPLFGRHEFNDSGFHDLAEKMLTQKVSKVFGAVFFYLNVLTNLRQTTQSYISRQESLIAERMAEVERGLQDIGVNMDGTPSLILSQLEMRLKKMN